MHSGKSKQEIIAFARDLATKDYKQGAGYTTTLDALCDLLEAEDPITPTMGDMNQTEHMAFILRIFMYFVEKVPSKNMTVDLRDVLATTKGRQMQVMLDGHNFSARTIADVIVPEEAKRKFIQ